MGENVTKSEKYGPDISNMVVKCCRDELHMMDWVIQCSSCLYHIEMAVMYSTYRNQQLTLYFMSGLDIVLERWDLMLNKMKNCVLYLFIRHSRLLYFMFLLISLFI